MPQRTYRFQVFAEVETPGAKLVAIDLDEDLVVEDRVEVTEDFLRRWACDRAVKTVRAKGLDPTGQVNILRFAFQHTA